MAKATKILSEYVLMAAAVLWLLAAALLLASTLIGAKKTPVVTLQEANAADVAVDDNGYLKYQGKVIGQLKKYSNPPEPKGMPVPPNGAENTQAVSLGNGSWLITGGNLKETESQPYLLNGSKDNFIFDERTKRFQSLPPLAEIINQPDYIKLANGNVIVLGAPWESKEDLSLVQLIDPTHKSISTLCFLPVGYNENLATLEVAPNKVLVVTGPPSNSADAYLLDVDKRTCKEIGSFNHERFLSVIFPISRNDFLVVDSYGWQGSKTKQVLHPMLIKLPQL